METKKKYNSPMIVCIQLDSEISLVLASDIIPPAGPSESNLQAPQYFNNDPYKVTV